MQTLFANFIQTEDYEKVADAINKAQHKKSWHIKVFKSTTAVWGKDIAIKRVKTLPEHVDDLTRSLQGFVDSFGNLATELGQTAQALK